MSIPKRLTYIAITTVICLFLVNRIFFFHTGFLERTSSTITYPFICISSSISKQAKKIVHKRKTYEALFDAHMQLKKDYEKLFEEVVTLRETIRTNNLTEELNSFKARYNLENAVLCKILVKNFTPDAHYYLINRGARDGIQQDMVAVYKLQILGKVTEVFPCYSKVTLLSDKTCKIAAFTNTTSAKGIATGTNDVNTLKMLYVSQLDTITDNDLVFSSGQGLVFPEGFCLGRITAHNFEKKDLYHDISLAPIIDLQKINHCLLTDQSKINLF